MTTTNASPRVTDTRGTAPGRDIAPPAALEQAIESAAQLLPAQGPITVYVAQNRLPAFEVMPFHEALQKALAIYDCQPYLTEDRYRQELARGRIREEDLVAVLREMMGPAAEERILSLGKRIDLRLAMIKYPTRLAPHAELRWFVAETDALTRYRTDAPAAVRDRFLQETRHWVMRDLRGGHPSREASRQDRRDHDALADLFRRFGASNIEKWSDRTWEAFSLQALWRVCHDGVHAVRSAPAPAPASVRHRNLLLEATGVDTDSLVDVVLIRFCAAFLDQGFSPWRLPNWDLGFYGAFRELYRHNGGPADPWMSGLAAELGRLEDAHLSPLESVEESLELLGVPPEEWEGYLTSTLMALRGWAGLIRQMEVRPEVVPHPVPRGSLVAYLAVRLLLQRLALAYTARESLGIDVPLSELREAIRHRSHRPTAMGVEQQAFLVFKLAQALGLTPATLHHLSKEGWNTLVAEMEAFPSLERRHAMHLAYEHRYRTQALEAIACHAARPAARVPDPRFQVVCCIDDREESFLRDIEEVAPDAETFSMAGFFSVAMFYRGAAEAHFLPQCPVVVRPRHWVVEDVSFPLAVAARRRARVRRALGTATRYVHVGSRTFLGGAMTALLGVVASIPMVARVLFPRLAAGVRKLCGSFVQPPPMTKLRLERSAPTPGPEEGHIGFSLEEMANIATRVLEDLGLRSGFARLVIFLGHGSFSVNNPHIAVYNCGACGGLPGGSNGRAIAQILNDARVRKILAERGLHVPEDTFFLGGYHSTCKDTVTFADLDRLPHSHEQDFARAVTDLEEACARTAHERCRRFMSVPLSVSFAGARRAVEERSEDLSQTRPELGHAGVALCVVGRRSRTRGLFLDRRAFLNSYDPTQDDAEHTILARILAPAVPVCQGIGLEYYFSRVDPTGWGSGSKLPHNVASLLGVMNGAASDIRNGLPWQGVEIHEPMRLLFVIETTPEGMLQVMSRNKAIDDSFRNGWSHLVVLDPESTRMHLFRNGRFEPYVPEPVELPRVASYSDWYRGWRDNLGFAQLAAEVRPTPRPD